MGKEKGTGEAKNETSVTITALKGELKAETVGVRGS